MVYVHSKHCNTIIHALGHSFLVTKEDHSKSDCILVAIMSHGIDGKVFASDHMYEPSILWDRLTADKVPCLAGKPKIFLIQACRGNKSDLVSIGPKTRQGANNATQTDGTIKSARTPARSDFLMVFSCYPGY